jgi:hypothetical protein
MKQIQFFLGAFRDSFQFQVQKLGTPGSLGLLHILQDSLRWLQRTAFFLFLLWFGLHWESKSGTAWIYPGLMAGVLVFLPFLIRKRVSLAILNGYQAWFQNGSNPGVTRLLREAPQDLVLYRKVLSELSKLPVKAPREFYGTVAFFLEKKGTSNKISSRVTPEALAGWEDLLSLQKTSYPRAVFFCRGLLLFLAFVYLFPTARMSTGVEFLVLGKQVTVSNLAFFSILGAFLLGFFEMFQTSVSKQANLKYCLGVADPSSNLMAESLSEMRDCRRGVRVPLVGWLVESYLVDLVFLAGLLFFSLFLGWLMPFFFEVFCFALYFVLPRLLRGIGDSRLFLRIQLAGSQFSSRGGQLLLGLLFLGIFTQFLGGFLFFLVWIPGLPHALESFPLPIILRLATFTTFISGLLFLALLRRNPLPQRKNMRIAIISILFFAGLFSLVLSGSFSGLSYSLAGIMILGLGVVNKMMKGV